MSVLLKVNFETQLGIGGHVAGTKTRDDPTGCWYACVCMIGHYFEQGPRQGVPELFKKNLGDGQLGHFATGSKQANKLSPNHHELLAKRENLEAVANCAKAYNYSFDELEALLRSRGPMFMYWMKSHRGSTYGHASVIIGVDRVGVVYHDPESAPNSRMTLARFNSSRQKWKYALMQRRATARAAVRKAMSSR
ncbi:MAG: papain-like cysteine protease family protein [Pseudomonadota bacterium]